jgi:hypothetical protein
LIFQSCEKDFRVRREELPKKSEVFHKTLENLLGVAATKIVESMIAKKLYDKLALNFEKHDGWTLIDYVEDAKKAKSN